MFNCPKIVGMRLFIDFLSQRHYSNWGFFTQIVWIIFHFFIIIFIILFLFKF